MKCFSNKLMAGLLLLCLAGGSAWAQTRIATVDVRKVFDNYWKTKQADAVLKDRAAEMEKDFKEMITNYDKVKLEYQKLLTSASDQAVSTDEREKRKRDSEEKLKTLKETEETLAQYRRSATAQLDEQKRRMRDKILEEIRTVLNARAKSGSFSLILDSTAESATGTPVVLFTDHENDLTSAVLQDLNTSAPPETSKAPEKAADKPGKN